MLRAGDLDHRLRIEREVELSRNAANEPVTEWREVATVWASKEDVRDSERVAAQQIGATITARFVVRRSSVTLAVDPTCRLVCRGVTYDVTGRKDVGLDGLEFTAAARAEIQA